MTLPAIRSLVDVIQHHERSPAPAHQYLQVHVARLGALIRRCEEGYGGLLNLRFGLRGQLRKPVPGFIMLQMLFQQGGRLVFDVIEVVGGRVGLNKPRILSCDQSYTANFLKK